MNRYSSKFTKFVTSALINSERFWFFKITIGDLGRTFFSHLLIDKIGSAFTPQNIL